MGLEYRHETPDDVAGVREVNLKAFPTALEADLVDALRQRLDPWLSFVVHDGDKTVGHVLYTPVTPEPVPSRPLACLALGPMAVHPDHQGRGIGSTLVDWSLSEVERAHEVAAIFVLGHPEWYPRFGFQPAAHYGIRIGLDAPAEAFLAKAVSGGALAALKGSSIHYHPAFTQ